MRASRIKQTVNLIAILAAIFILQNCQKHKINNDMAFALNQKLEQLANETEIRLIADSFRSIKTVIEAERNISTEEAAILESMYLAFLNDTLANPSLVESYLDRERTLILAWKSPKDRKTSFTWLRLPNDWDPEKEYPLYVHLHGYWDVAAEPISYMSFTFTAGPSTTTAFEDGYWLSPWGRGNKWYEGISKTDVWEAIANLEEKVSIDDSRRYLSGHSMGGYGTWQIAQESADKWAAIGLHSAAVFYKEAKYVDQQYAYNLKDVPSYFVWGTNEEEGYHTTNNELIRLLTEAGNQHVEKTLFEGGHDYNEPDVEAMYNWMRMYTND